jgi:hypothetical protein
MPWGQGDLREQGGIRIDFDADAAVTETESLSNGGSAAREWV